MRAAEKNKRKKGKFFGKNFFGKNWNFPLALFCSWGIFLPVAGDEPDDGKRRSKLKGVEFEKRRSSESRKRK